MVLICCIYLVSVILAIISVAVYVVLTKRNENKSIPKWEVNNFGALISGGIKHFKLVNRRG